MSPYILIDKELEAFADPATPFGFAGLLRRQLITMMTDDLITIPEFNPYCERLNKIIDRRMEAP